MRACPIGSVGTEHKYLVSWNGADYDVYIDNSDQGTAYRNGYRIPEIETGVEARYCAEIGGRAVVDPIIQYKWAWWESNTTGHTIVPRFTNHTNAPGEAWNYWGNPPTIACAHINTNAVC